MRHRGQSCPAGEGIFGLGPDVRTRAAVPGEPTQASLHLHCISAGRVHHSPRTGLPGLHPQAPSGSEHSTHQWGY